VSRWVCVALVVMAGLVAAATSPGAEFSTADLTYAGQTEQGYAAYVQVLPHRAGVTAAFTYQTSCTGTKGSILWTGVARASLKGGRFHYSRKEDAKGPQITLDGTMGTAAASGTWHVHFTVRDELGTAHGVCDSGKVEWTLPRDGAGGQVATGYPIVLRVKKPSVKSIELMTEVKCKSGDAYLIPSYYADFRIARDGTFGRKFNDDGTPVAGRTSKLTIELHGRLRRGRIKGTWRLNVVFSDEGKQVDTCDSGPLSWTARI
jgi:hypothetical protein